MRLDKSRPDSAIVPASPAKFVKYLNNFTVLASVVCYAFIGYLLIFHLDLIKLFFTDYTQLYSFLSEGLRGPIFIIALIFSVVLAVNPFAQLVPIASIIAFFFGFEKGFIFCVISVLISTLLTLMLSKHYGERAVKRIVGENNWQKVKILADEEGAFPFFIAHLFPVFPDAIVVWVAGMTNISVIKLLLASLIGRIPGILLTVAIGSGLVTENLWLTTGMFILLVGISTLLARYRKQILKLINLHK